MNRRLHEANQIQRLGEKKNGRAINRYNRPFWMAASSYYILSFAVTVAFFFLIWGILQEGEEEAPWISAGIAASFVLASAVFLREIVLKKARNRFLLAQRQLDGSLNKLTIARIHSQKSEKLTVQKNAEIINEIKQKSDAAQNLKKLPNAHLEVFEICNEYLLANKRALETVGAGSPRIAALRRGREIILQLHRFHLLTWAGMETRALTREAKNQVRISDKLKNAQKAQTVLESALQFYPDEIELKESEKVINEFIASIKISHWIEQAERAEFKENYKRAISHYRDALFFLARENIQKAESELIAGQINQKIEEIRRTENKKREAKEISAGADLENEEDD